MDLSQNYNTQSRRPKAVILDMDNTIAILSRDSYNETLISTDRLNTVLHEVLLLLRAQGYHIVIMTGRHERVRLETINWLSKYNVPFTEMFMRPNEDNITSSVKLKINWYDFNVKYKYDVLLAFDDMYQTCYAFRDRGIDAWQVATDPFAKRK